MWLFGEAARLRPTDRRPESRLRTAGVGPGEIVHFGRLALSFCGGPHTVCTQGIRRDSPHASPPISADYCRAGAVASGSPDWAAAAASRSANEKLNIGIIGPRPRRRQPGRAWPARTSSPCATWTKNIWPRPPRRSPAQDLRRLAQAARAERHRRRDRQHDRATHAPASVWPWPRASTCIAKSRSPIRSYEARVGCGRNRPTKKVATQMGTQIHATDNYRRVVELVRAGAIGPSAKRTLGRARHGRSP